VLALAVMLLEVALTRIFSFITYHHMTYLVIGVGMLGFGAAGTRLTLRPPASDPAERDRRLSRNAAGFAVATLVALFVIPKIRFYPMNMDHIGDARNFLSLGPIIVLSAAPFFFGGLGIADLLSGAGKAVNRLYFADLVGSAIGSLASIALVNWVGALSTSVLAAAAALLAAAIAAPTRTARLAYVGAGVLLGAASPVAEQPGVLPLTVPPGKQMYGSEASIEHVDWHAITRLDVGSIGECRCSFGGALSRKYDGPSPLARLIFQDGSNLTGIIHPTPTPEETPALGFYVQGAPYRIRKEARALVIGSGGGVDVMVGLHHGAKHVVAVDVNPKTMALVRGKYSEFAGHVFNSPRVEPVVSEGRHFLGRDARKFDVIQLSGVDTWAALSSGAIALTENFIYTAEAFDAYLAHLEPDGLLGFSRPFIRPPLETLRLAATAIAALERLGVKEAHRHLFVVAGHGQAADAPWAELLVKRSPFTEAEVEELGKFAREMDFFVAYDPFHERREPLDFLARASTSGRKRLLANYPLNVKPVTDDTPFYFQYHRWRDLFGEPPIGLRPPAAMWVLIASLVQVVVLSAAFILLPLSRRTSRASVPGGRAGIFGYFASLGMGFILVEIGLLSKLTIFLGGPAYALSITLSTLLSASGVGSYLAGRLRLEPLALVQRVVPVACVVILGQAWLLDRATEPLMGLPLVGRALATVVLIGPLGILLGMPFPTGLRLVDETRPELKPWAWAINAFCTVVGTSTCMILVTAYGFSSALFVGAAVYLAGAVALTLGTRPLVSVESGHAAA
jgi:hypothetical protein